MLSSPFICLCPAHPSQSGILDKYGVELIGAKLPSIDRAEDRLLFKEAMQRIGLKTPPSGTATNIDEALAIHVRRLGSVTCAACCAGQRCMCYLCVGQRGMCYLLW
jgi:hypothetical protein